MTRQAIRETVSRFDAVFEGVILSVAYIHPERRPGVFPLDEAVATVAVKRQWKGKEQDTVMVRTALFTTACGLPFQQSERYLLFARKTEAGVYADKCGPSRVWDKEAERLVKLLGSGHRLQ